MKLRVKQSLRGRLAVLGAVLALPAAANASISMWDDVSPALLSNGYQGFNWSNVGVANGATEGAGYSAGVVSPSNVGYNAFASASEVTSLASGLFTVNSVDLTAAWRDNLNVTLTGYSGVTPIFTTTVNPSAIGATQYNLNWVDITKLKITSSGGTQHIGYAKNFAHVVMDNLSITRIYRWQTPGGGAWGTGSNWDLTVSPYFNDDAMFDIPSTYSVNIPAATNLRKLYFNDGEVTLNLAGSNLTASSTMSFGANGSAVLTPATGNKALVVGDVAMASGGALDLSNNNLIIRAANNLDAAAKYANAEALVKAGFNDFNWDGTGINSSFAAAAANLESSPMLGIIDNTLWGHSDIEGEPVGPNDIIVKYTYAGDANLDGMVDNDDFGQFLYGYSGSGAAIWLNGDFDYNGIVNNDDFIYYIVGHAAFVNSGSPLAEELSAEVALFATEHGLPLLLDPTPVPEPTCLAITGAAAALLRRRRRRSLAK